MSANVDYLLLFRHLSSVDDISRHPTKFFVKDANRAFSRINEHPLHTNKLMQLLDHVRAQAAGKAGEVMEDRVAQAE